MWTSIGDRKIVICFHSPGGAQRGSAGPADHHAAVGRRHDDVGVLRHLAFRIAEEEGEEPAEHREGGGQPPTARNRERSGRHECGRDERKSGAIDFHGERVLGYRVNVTRARAVIVRPLALCGPRLR